MRTYRAISWLECAEAREHDAHATFVFLWISFNAAYGSKAFDDENDGHRRPPLERRRIDAFFERLVSADSEGALTAASQEARDDILTLLNSKQIYWRHVRNQEGYRDHGDWHRHFRQENAAAEHALQEGSGRNDPVDALRTAFERLSTLRNLLLHGQISWRSRIADPLLVPAARLLGAVVPAFVRLMINHRDSDWEEPSLYPDVYRQDRIEPKPHLP